MAEVPELKVKINGILDVFELMEKANKAFPEGTRNNHFKLSKYYEPDSVRMIWEYEFASKPFIFTYLLNKNENTDIDKIIYLSHIKMELAIVDEFPETYMRSK